MGGSRPYPYPLPHGTIRATNLIINEVGFIPVNPSPLLKVVLPLGSALSPVPTFLVKHLSAVYWLGQGGLVAGLGCAGRLGWAEGATGFAQ